MATVPSDDIMNMMAKVAVKKVTTWLAEIAETMAREMRDGVIPSVSGPEALDAFARIIRAVNAKRYPKNDTRN